MSGGHALEELESLVLTPRQLTSLQSGHNIVEISMDDLLKHRNKMDPFSQQPVR